MCCCDKIFPLFTSIPVCSVVVQTFDSPVSPGWRGRVGVLVSPNVVHDQTRTVTERSGVQANTTACEDRFRWRERRACLHVSACWWSGACPLAAGKGITRRRPGLPLHRASALRTAVSIRPPCSGCHRQVWAWSGGTGKAPLRRASNGPARFPPGDAVSNAVFCHKADPEITPGAIQAGLGSRGLSRWPKRMLA
jgi:hypothetical protein